MPRSTNATPPKNALRARYVRDAVPALQQQFGYTNVHAVPRITRVVLNVGLGRSQGDAKALEVAQATLARITGQKPVPTRAKKSIASFKVRQGMTIGTMVTLRGPRMWDFLWRLVAVTFPRIRDFQGLKPTAFGRSGTFTYGFKENLAFPEMKSDELDRLHGLEVSVITSAKTPAEGLALLRALGFPFQTS